MGLWESWLVSTGPGSPTAWSCKCVIDNLGRWGSLRHSVFVLLPDGTGRGHTALGNVNIQVALLWAWREGEVITPGPLFQHLVERGLHLACAGVGNPTGDPVTQE